MGSKDSGPHLSLLQCVEFLGVKVGFEGRAFKVLELNFETLVQDKSIVYRLQHHIWMKMQIGLRLLCATKDLVTDLKALVQTGGMYDDACAPILLKPSCWATSRSSSSVIHSTSARPAVRKPPQTSEESAPA